MDSQLTGELPVLPGRLQRLADELNEEGVPSFGGASDPVAALVELAYALRPKIHENRVPTYGALLPVEPLFAERLDSLADTRVELIGVEELDLSLARRFADGVTSFAVRSEDSISHIACFSRNMADEYDLVGLQSALGGLIVQRHPGGQVRMFSPDGVVRWNGISWYHDAPIDAWIRRLVRVVGSSEIDGVAIEHVRPLLKFAIHELGGRRIGATLIWRTTDAPPSRGHVEPLVHHVPQLHLDDVGEEAAIAHALAQTDGAAIFDRNSTLMAMGIRLAPSSEAEQTIGSMGGMRHTSALRYSHDDSSAVVIVVSDAGPVTLMHHGKAITEVDPANERIG